MKRTLFFIFTAAITIVGCDSNPVGPSDIIGDTWRLVSLVETGTTPVTIDDPSKYTITFQNDGRIAVKSDCNTCGGEYSMAGSSIEIEPVTCTKVFCGDDSQDRAFTSALEKADTADVDDDELTIRGEGVRLTFVRN